MKHMSKLLLLALVLTVLVSTLALTAQASEIVASGTCGTDLTWILDDSGTLTISGTGAMQNFYGSRPWNVQEVKTVVIQEGVTSIGYSAFRDCSGLTSISIPEGVISIGDYAFAYCSSLASISIPEGVTSMGDWAFRSCTSLTDITIPKGVTSIGDYTFCDCRNMKNITILEGVTSIGDDAFSSCTSLLSVSLPEGLSSIGDDAFYGCTSLSSVSLPEGLSSIGNNAFYKCSKLTSISIPEGVTSIGDNAFYKCTKLASISIPGSLTNIGREAFYDCNSLKKVYITDLAAWCSIYFESDEANPCCKGAALYIDGILAEEITIPEGVTIIGDNAFFGCTSLTSIMIPEGVTGIRDAAFSDCSSLTSITIPESVTSIGSAAFSNCSSLPSITIPEGVTSIADWAFSGCSGLTSITIPEGVTSIGNYAFRDCSGLISISIPESVTSIGNYAFRDCRSLKNITIPEGVTSIGASTFYYCTSLESIIIPEGVTNIGSSAFYGCSSLPSITIPEGVTNIGNSAFYGCTNLTQIEFQGDVPAIGISAFGGVAAQVIYPADNTTWTADAMQDYGGTMTWIAEESKYKLYSVSVSVGNTLGMYFWIPEGNVAEGDYAVVTQACADGTAKEVTVAMSSWSKAGTFYLVPVTGIAAKEMMDDVTCTVYSADGTQKSAPGTSSIRKYVDSQLKLSTTKDALKTVMIDMLNYGAAAQTQFAYNTANPANRDLDDYAAYATASIDMEGLGHHAVKGEGMYGGTLTLKSSILMSVFFETTTVDRDMTAKISYTNYKGSSVSFEITGDQFQAIGTVYLVVNIESLVAADIATVVNVDIYDGETLVSHGEYNMAQYCQSTPTNATSIALAKYCTSARTYFGY